MKINLCMIVKNEERSLARCLAAASPLVDDVVIADTGSTDGTIAIAEDFARELERERGRACVFLYHFAWVNDFAAARNFVLEKSEELGADYNLVLDADETLFTSDTPEGERPAGIPGKVYGTGRRELEAFLAGLEERTGTGHGSAGSSNARGNVSGKASRGKGARTGFPERRTPCFLGTLGLYDQFRDGEEISRNLEFIPRILPGGCRYEGAVHEQPSPGTPIFRSPLYADHDGYLLAGKGDRNLVLLMAEEAKDADDPYVQFQLGATLRNMKRPDEALPHFRVFFNMGEPDTGYWADGVLLYLYTLLDLGGDALEEASGVMVRVEPLLQERADYWFYCGLFWTKLIEENTAEFAGMLPMIEESYRRCLSIGEKPEEGGVIGTGSLKAAYNLALYYEMSGQKDKAAYYYRQAAAQGYEPAEKRLAGLQS